MSTSTAQLIDRSANEDVTNGRYGEQTNSGDAQTQYRKVSKHLKLHTFVLSAITLGCLIADYILIRRAPSGSYNYPQWEARHETRDLGKWVLSSLVISIVNFAIPLHAIITLALSITFASGIIVELVDFFRALPGESWCARYGYPPQYPTPGPLPSEPGCEKAMKVVKIMMIVSGVLASLLAAVYILRAVARGLVILRSRFWEKSSWSIPTGSYTFQISLNVIRGDAALADTSSGPSHGPVHL